MYAVHGVIMFIVLSSYHRLLACTVMMDADCFGQLEPYNAACGPPCAEVMIVYTS